MIVIAPGAKTALTMAGPVNLLDIVSWEVSDALDYLTELDRKLSENALLKRFGRSLDDVRIDLKAIPFDAEAEAEEVQEREHFRRVAHGRDRDDDYEPADPDERDRRIYGARGRPRTAQPQPLDLLLAPLLCAVILGDPGGGKTEFLKDHARTAERAAKAALRSGAKPLADVVLPVYLHLRDLATELGDEKGLRDCLGRFGITAATPLADPLRVPAAILQALSRPNSDWSPRLARVLWRQLTARTGDAGAAALVCLDAWDELREGHSALAKFLGAYVASTGAKMLTTSRIAGYIERDPPVPTDGISAAALRICPFERPDTETFIARFFSRNEREQEIGRRLSGELRTRVAVAGMAENPLLTTLLCMAYWPEPKKRPLALPNRRGELYERILHGLLGDWPDQVVIKQRVEGGPSRKGLIAPKLALITALARRFFPAQLLSEADILDFFWGRGGYFAEGGPAVSPAQPLQQVMQATGLSMQDLLCEDGVLVRIGSDGFAFLHLTFQEFLTARALAARPWEEIAGQIDRKSWLAAWEEVVILLAGQLEDEDSLQLLLLLSDPRTDDFLKRRTVLAALAIAEIRPRSRDLCTACIDQITETIVDRILGKRAGISGGEVDQMGRGLTALVAAKGRYRGTPPSLWLRTQARDRVVVLGHLEIGAADSELQAILTQLLSDDEPQVRSAAAEATGRLGAATTRELQVALIRLLSDHEPQVRSAAAQAAGRLGAAASPELQGALTRLLCDDQPDVRRAGAAALRGFGAAASPELQAALTRLLSDDEPHVRRVAVWAAGRLGAATSRELQTALTRLLSDDEPHIQWDAAEAVGGLGAATSPELQLALIRLLSDDEPRVRWAAEHAVGGLGAAASGELQVALTRLFSDDEPDVRSAAAHAVGGLGAAESLELQAALARLLSDDEPHVRSAAAEATGRLGAATTRELQVALIRLLSDHEPQVRSAAAQAAGRLGAAASPDLQVSLTRLLADDDAHARLAAVEAVGRLGAAASPELQATLTRTLADGDRRIRLVAAKAADRLRAVASRELEAALIRRLADGDWGVKLAAARALDGIGPAASSYVAKTITDMLRLKKSVFYSLMNDLFAPWHNLRVFERKGGWLARSLSELSSEDSSPETPRLGRIARPNDTPS